MTIDLFGRIDAAGPVHCVSVNIPRCASEYLNGAADMKLGVAGKLCHILEISST